MHSSPKELIALIARPGLESARGIAQIQRHEPCEQGRCAGRLSDKSSRLTAQVILAGLIKSP